MRKSLLHLFFWFIFFLMWNRVMYFYIDNTLNRLYFSTLDVSLVATAFYAIYSYVMPNYLKRKNIGLLLVHCSILLIALTALYSWAMLIFLRHELIPIHFEFAWQYTDLQYNRFFITLVGVLGGCFVKLAMDRIALGKQMQLLEKEKSVAELTYLKSQVNPHFLFNSLNSVYAQMDMNLGNAKNTLTALADLLRYQLYDCNANLIPIAQEMAYLKNYFDLQSIRMDNCTSSFNIEKPSEELQIAPLLLIPFIENAFKYVSDFNDDKNYITVELLFKKQLLIFRCDNTKEKNTFTEAPTKHHGIGLVNVKKRLELIYGEAHLLQIDEEEKLYKVYLEIDLKNVKLFDH